MGRCKAAQPVAAQRCVLASLATAICWAFLSWFRSATMLKLNVGALGRDGPPCFVQKSQNERPQSRV